MYHPTSRVLTVLELLQSHAQISGMELAERLEVDRRTVRRYIVQLQDLGIPVESERGRYGSYLLRPGFKLPPLMFSETEAIALMLGLMTVRKLQLADANLAVEGAIAKVLRVMPQDLRQRVQAIQKTLVVDEGTTMGKTVTHEVLATLGLAVQQQRQINLCYESYGGDRSERTIDPYGLVFRTDCWYAVGYCHLRQDLRTFRLDRVVDTTLLDSTFTQPKSFDPLSFIERSLANTPRQYRVEILLRVSLEEARAKVPTALGQLTEVDTGILMVGHVDSLSWLAQMLLSWSIPLTILSPPELHDEIKQLRNTLEQMLTIA
jgi:predicted DNA-binding transcriptional regulator YafY